MHYCKLTTVYITETFCFVYLYVFKNFTQWFSEESADNLNTEKSRCEACVCLVYRTLSSTLKI